MSKKSVKCRSCNVVAQMVEIKGETYVVCPVCKNRLPVEEVLALIGKQSRAFAAKTLQDGFKSLSRSVGKSGPLSISYRPTHIKDPGGDFFLDFDE